MEDIEIVEQGPDSLVLSPQAEAAVEAILEKKGEEVAIFDVQEFTAYVDFHILVTAVSAAHAKVLQDAIKEKVGLKVGQIRSIEGDIGSVWILIDFWDLVVHIFRPELRQYYNLESLWADFPSITVKLRESNG